MSIELAHVPDKMRALVAKVLDMPPEDVTLASSTRNTRHWDSLRHVELVVEIEEAYGVSFAATEVFALTSVRGFCDMLARKNVDPDA